MSVFQCLFGSQKVIGEFSQCDERETLGRECKTKQWTASFKQNMQAECH